MELPFAINFSRYLLYGYQFDRQLAEIVLNPDEVRH